MRVEIMSTLLEQVRVDSSGGIEARKCIGRKVSEKYRGFGLVWNDFHVLDLE